MTGRLRRLLGGLLRAAVVVAVVGGAVIATLPGGPVDRLRPAGEPETPEAAPAGTSVTEEGGAPAGPAGRSPWEESVLVVEVRNRADPDRDVDGAVRAALAYWNGHLGYADYPATFVLREDPAAPDVVVWYNRSIDCPDHDDAIGCAPLLEAGTDVEPPVAVQLRYDASDNRRQVRNTVIHEFGHVLGITHCEPPRWVMAPACDEPVPPAPNATERDLAWRDQTLAVHVDYSNVSADEREATRRQVTHALEYLEDDPSAALPAEVRFVEAADRFDADVTVTFLAAPECPDGAVVCHVRHGRDVDHDGRMEYYTRGEIAVAPGSDVSARGWYVGRALSMQVAPGHVPAVFRDADHRERRSRWWE